MRGGYADGEVDTVIDVAAASEHDGCALLARLPVARQKYRCQAWTYAVKNCKISGATYKS
jgi:hypothetical protein